MYKLDKIQLHGNESPGFCQEIRKFGLPVIKSLPVIPVSELTDWTVYQDAADYLLFDTACKGYGGSGKSFDWSLLEQYKGELPFLLSGGIRASHLSELQQFSHPRWAGIDLNSGFETAPGMKDAPTLRLFISQFKQLK